LNKKYFRNLFLGLPRLTTLTIKGEMSDDYLDLFPTSLKSLQLFDCSELQHFDQTRFPNLNKLLLYRLKKIGFPHPFLVNASNLVSLFISEVDDANGDLSTFKNLKTLYLFNCKFNQFKFNDLFLTKLPTSITNLTITYCDTPIELESISHLNKLKYLDVKGTSFDMTAKRYHGRLVFPKSLLFLHVDRHDLWHPCETIPPPNLKQLQNIFTPFNLRLIPNLQVLELSYVGDWIYDDNHTIHTLIICKYGGSTERFSDAFDKFRALKRVIVHYTSLKKVLSMMTDLKKIKIEYSKCYHHNAIEANNTKEMKLYYN